MADLYVENKKQKPNTPPQDTEICKRCKENEVAITIRLEPMCRSCFAKYLNLKFRKNMDCYRVGKLSKEAVAPRKVGVALSLGTSSVSMWSWVMELLKNQLQRTSRTGFEPVVLLVDETALDSSLPSSKDLEAVEGRFPGYKYRSIPLESVYEHSRLVGELSSASEEFEATVVENTAESNTQKLRKLISLLESRSSQLDMINILRSRLLIEAAKSEGCEGLIFGDSTTRLAEKTFAETAKGRGHAIPWLVSDGPTPYGITLIRPLRDIYRDELNSYAKFASLDTLCVSPPLFNPKNHQGPTASRHISLDEIISQYFTEVEAKQPNVIANVVKTAARLVSLNTETVRVPSIVENGVGNVQPDDGLCEICGLPRDDAILAWSNRKRDNNGVDESHADAANRRSAETYRLANRMDTVDRSRQCYGCARALRGTGDDLEWPSIRSTFDGPSIDPS